MMVTEEGNEWRPLSWETQR